MKTHLILVPFLAIGRLFESQPIESTHVNILRQNSNFDRNTSWHEHEHNHNIPPRRNTSLDIAFSNRQNRSSSVIKEQPRQVPTPALYLRKMPQTLTVGVLAYQKNKQEKRRYIYMCIDSSYIDISRCCEATTREKEVLGAVTQSMLFSTLSSGCLMSELLAISL